jgi:HK97 family phage portal protein
MARLTRPDFRMERRDTLENPSVPLSSPQAWALLAGQNSTDSGVNVSEFSAMRVTAMWRAVHLIAGTIAQMPLNVWDGKRGEASNRKPVDTPWIDNPNDEVDWLEFIETSLAHILLWGNAYWLPVYTNLGDEIAQIWALSPWNVTPTRKLSPRPGVPGPKSYRVAQGSGLTLSDADLVHFPGLGYDGIRGLSPVSHARQALGLGVAAEQYGARLFGSGTLMGGIVTTDQKLDKDQADTIKARWRDKLTGLAKAHEVAVLDNGLKFTPLGIPPEDAQFLMTREFSVSEIARLYGVPPHLLMQVEKTTTWGSGIAEQSLSFVRYTLSQWTARFEQRITKRLCKPGQYAEFDNSQLLRGDVAARYSSYGNATMAGWLCPNEVRIMEGKVPIGAQPPDGYDPHDPQYGLWSYSAVPDKPNPALAAPHEPKGS